MKGQYRGELERLKDAINQAVQNLDQALRQVSLSVEQAATAADQISVGVSHMQSSHPVIQEIYGMSEKDATDFTDQEELVGDLKQQVRASRMRRRAIANG